MTEEYYGFVNPVYLTDISKAYMKANPEVNWSRIFPQVQMALSIEERADRERKRKEREAVWRPPQSWINLIEWVKFQPESAAVTALAATLALHVPIDRMYSSPEHNSCQGCDAGSYAEDDPDWPCSTIRVIAAALGYPLKET